MAGDVTNIRMHDIQVALQRLDGRLSMVESELIRSEALTTAVGDLKTLMNDHMRNTLQKSDDLEKRLASLQLHMISEINKLQKAVLIAVLGGAGAGATAMKVISTLLGG